MRTSGLYASLLILKPMGTLTGATKSNIHIEIEKKLTFCLYIQLILPNGTGPVKIFCEGSEDVMMALGFEDSKSSLDVTSLKEICVGLHFRILVALGRSQEKF